MSVHFVSDSISVLDSTQHQASAAAEMTAGCDGAMTAAHINAVTQLLFFVHNCYTHSNLAGYSLMLAASYWQPLTASIIALVAQYVVHSVRVVLSVKQASTHPHHPHSYHTGTRVMSCTLLLLDSRKHPAPVL